MKASDDSGAEREAGQRRLPEAIAEQRRKSNTTEGGEKVLPGFQPRRDYRAKLKSRTGTAARTSCPAPAGPIPASVSIPVFFFFRYSSLLVCPPGLPRPRILLDEERLLPICVSRTFPAVAGGTRFAASLFQGLTRETLPTVGEQQAFACSSSRGYNDVATRNERMLGIYGENETRIE